MPEENNPTGKPQNASGHTTDEIRRHGEEALRMLRESQNRRRPDSGSTTHNLAREAMEAMRLQQEREHSDIRHAETSQAHFDDTLFLRVDITDSTRPLLLTVKDDVIIGRADSGAEFQPDIDLTPYGGYRLGISRRHACISRKDNRLLLADLSSRNGTVINGEALGENETRLLSDGDEVQFGNLKVRFTFQRKT